MKTYRFLFIIFICVFGFSSKAQVITGHLIDSSDQNNAVSFATITIFNTKDSSIVKFGVSDDSGRFDISQLPINIPLRALFSHINYRSRIRNFSFDSLGQVIDLGNLKMSPKDITLQEIEITWEKPPILVRNDTVEFNADAFLKRPGAMVEDLLKRIPGAVVEKDGTVTVNGRKVNRILVDGKSFFGDNPTAVLKNLPAYTIDKVQVTEDKDENGVLKENGEVVINLTLKSAAKKGHFGKAFAGYGTTGRYESGLIWNLFKDTTQISIIGYGNNLSQSGFSFDDLFQLGGFNRSGANTIMWNGSSIFIDGVSFGGGRGITTSNGLGFNFNHDIPKKLTFNVSWFYGNTLTEMRRSNETARILPENVLFTTQNGMMDNRSISNNINSKLLYRFDSLKNLSLGFRGSFSNGSSLANAFTLNSYQNSPDSGFLNNDANVLNASSSYFGEARYYQQIDSIFSFNLSYDYDFKDIPNTQNNNFQNRFPSANIFEELYQTRYSKNFKEVQNFKALLTIKLNKKVGFNVGSNYILENEKLSVKTYQRDSSEQILISNDLSGDFSIQYKNWLHNLSANIEVLGARLRLGVDLKQLNWETQDSGKVISNYSNWFVLPNISISKRIKRRYYYYAYVRRQVRTPNFNNFIFIRNNIQQTNITLGNPNLRPYGENSAYVSGNYNNEVKKYGINFYLSGNFADELYLNRSTFDSLGVRTSMLENTKRDNYNFYSSLSFNKSWVIKKDYQLRTGASINFSIGNSWFENQMVLIETKRRSINPRVFLNIDNDEKFGIELGYSPNYQINTVSNFSGEQIAFNQGMDADIWVKPIWGIMLETKINYNAVSNYGNIGNTSIIYTLWSAAISKSFLKDQSLNIRISYYDILRQNNNISLYVSEDSRITERINVVTQYIMLSASYNFNAFKKKRRGGLFDFWN